MESKNLKELLEQSNNKLEIFGNVELLRQCKTNLNDLYSLISTNLTSNEILELFNFPHFKKWEPRLKMPLLMHISNSENLLQALQDETIIKDFKSWDLVKLINKLGTNEKKTILNTPEFFETHKISTHEIFDIIKNTDDKTKCSLLSNKDLLINSLHLQTFDVVKLISELEHTNTKKSFSNLYHLSEFYYNQVAKTFNNDEKMEYLCDNPKINKFNQLELLQLLPSDYIVDFLNNNISSTKINPYEVIMQLDATKQENFIANFDKLHLSENEKKKF